VALLAVSLGSIVSVVQLTRPMFILNGDSLGSGASTSQACPPTTTTPSAALDIAGTAPAGVLPPGTTLSVSYGVQALTLPSGTSESNVELPGVTAIFALSGGGTFQIFVGAQTLTVTEGAWTIVTGHSVSFGTNTTFSAGPSAQLSTQLLAVMTTAPVGTLDLEVRWSWSIANVDGSSSSGPWTVPGTTGTFPSVFFPDPYVALVGESPSDEQTGAIFSVELSGAPGHTQFLLKLENATTGSTLNRAWFNSTNTAGATFSGSIQLSAGLYGLSPGTYLVHVHDDCGGILYSLSVHVAYPVPELAPAPALLPRTV
jgi:hypothetical protein